MGTYDSVRRNAVPQRQPALADERDTADKAATQPLRRAAEPTFAGPLAADGAAVHSLADMALHEPDRTQARATSVASWVAQRRANNTGLPDRLKTGVEALSGVRLDDVRVHYNSPKPADVQALAYTQGTDIHVAPGQEKHLPHEAWHVVQQKQGRVKPTLQMKGVAINDDAGLEKEAGVMGAQAGQAAQLTAAQCSPGCGCAACAKTSSASADTPYRAVQAIGMPAVIQMWKCAKCGVDGLKSSEKACSVCGTKRPEPKTSASDTKSASATSTKAAGGAANKVNKPSTVTKPSNNSQDSKSKESSDSKESATGQPTNSIRVQLQLVTPKEWELSEVVHHYDDTPITQKEGIDALNALLVQAQKVGVNKTILKQAYGEIGKKVVALIKGGSVGQSNSTYFETAEEHNRIDVENLRGDKNFSA